jgi:transposase
MRFLPSLTSEQHALLRAIFTRKDLRERERKRLTAVMLNAQHRLCIQELASLCQVSRHSIENWLDAYQQGGVTALLDGELAHHPSSLAAYEPRLVLEAVEENAQNLPLVVEQLAQQHQLPTTVGILKRYLKKNTGPGAVYSNR